jgi:predicted transcriptional regulator of viral defense system
MSTRKDLLLTLARRTGVLRARDLAAHGIDRKYLTRLVRDGDLQRVARGLYVATGAPPTEHQTLLEAARRVPGGVVCLISALRFHEITSQEPFEIWMALAEKAWRPQTDPLPIRFVHFSGEAWTYGVEEHEIHGVCVRAYGVAKTVADCFKHRNKIGLDIAIEALRETWRSRRATMDEIWTAAGVCRVQRVMKPYLESLA